ncbi:hydroxyneurosporene-O-methyltransferase [Mycolicibacterium chubuense NBB4]|uniref:Hydroxyneurosporene-O-methyltransferase n=1 Tax=Mycolicibacterium chubuense (strain NBB4) TaxID=710421 RepID=I4BI32_MYCCN|nr:methyltransferase [Mycolicibacterium chubuense]AFM16939.1 hydroxyneurosporene-O-methyltransferase [Mycolicibacterium chubuense NBB4]
MSPQQKKAPPVRLIRAIDRVRAGLASLHRSSVPGNVALLELATGAWTTQVLYVAAKLGIADRIAKAPACAADLATQLGADPDALHRLMRAMASRGVLRERRDGTFVLTAAGEALRSDVPGSMRDMVLFIGHPARWADWGELLYSVQTGLPASDKLRGMPFFEYLETDADLAEAFNNAMTAASGLSNEVALNSYDFTGARLVVDVGGGHGAVLATILRSEPAARGVLFDLPTVVAGAGPLLSAAGVAQRCTVEGGSFLESVPDGGDVYVMKNIIHDWNDDDALTILRNIRTAIADAGDRPGRLILLEMVLPERATSFIGHMLDLEMLLMLRGKERTRAQYADLLARAGFRLNRVIPTVSPVSVIEAFAD